MNKHIFFYFAAIAISGWASYQAGEKYGTAVISAKPDCVATNPVETVASSNESPEIVNVEPPSDPITQEPEHYYSMRDGYQYGYEMAVSADDINRGQAAKELLMFKYVGEHNGLYQVFTKVNEMVVSVMECSNPCEFIKTMIFIQGGKTQIQRMRSVEGTIGNLVLKDAINGNLEQYIAEKKGSKFTIWFDEKKGLISTPKS
jgi:hypothetical protein